MTQPSATFDMEMPPASLRVITSRLLSWLPTGPVRVSAGAHSLVRSLRRAGIDVVDGPDARAAVIVVRDEDEEISVSSALMNDAPPHLCLVVVGDRLDHTRRSAWERVVQRAGWRKHPLNERVAPYGALDASSDFLILAFEPVPPDALEQYPLEQLEAERDLHTDMTREAGRRSDAHMARYAQASKFIEPGARVLDVACGLGYGTWQLARSSRGASFIGIDASDFAVDYATTNFPSPTYPALRFQTGDAQDLGTMADGSAEFAVSVETLEHIPHPQLLLTELHRVLTPGGLVYASVPNNWADETGEDPNPFHLHVYDWPKLSGDFRRHGFTIEKAWLQDAGGGQKRHLARRSMLEFDVALGPPADGEWLLVLARKVGSAGAVVEDPLLRAADLLGAGERNDALCMLEALSLDASERLLASRAAAMLAMVRAGRGDHTEARTAWERCAAHAQAELHDVVGRAKAASLLALSLDAQSGNLPGRAELMAAHPAAFRLLPLDADERRDDREDRAVASGIGSESGAPNVTATALAEIIEAKTWLDTKFGEHVSRIRELEGYVEELEAARSWLDGQYHSLSEQVRQLSPGKTT